MNIYYLVGSWDRAAASRLLSLLPESIVRRVLPWQQRATEGKETDSHPDKAWICGLIKRFCAQGHLVNEKCLSETRGHKGLCREALGAPSHASMPVVSKVQSTVPWVRNSQVILIRWLGQVRKWLGSIFCQWVHKTATWRDWLKAGCFPQILI